MLMLTHTWILKMLLGPGYSENIDPDLFVHNVSPDILPVHKEITTAMTHCVKRLVINPAGYEKAAFVRFHLLVDDIAHYGEICNGEKMNFDPDSKGYAYRKGRPLIEPIIDFHRRIGEKISYNDAVYRSHILIEMAFDQLLQREEGDKKTALLFFNSLNYTVENRLDEFCRTSSWIYGLRKDVIAEAITLGMGKYSLGSVEFFATPAGRIALYTGKFGLDGEDKAIRSDLTNLLHCGMEAVGNYEEILERTLKTIRNSGFTLPL